MRVQLSSKYLQSIVDYVDKITPTSTITRDHRIIISGVGVGSARLECTIDHDPNRGSVEFSIRSTIIVPPECREAVERLSEQRRTTRSSDQIDMDANGNIDYTFYYRRAEKYLSPKEIEELLSETVSRISIFDTAIQHIISSS